MSRGTLSWAAAYRAVQKSSRVKYGRHLVENREPREQPGLRTIAQIEEQRVEMSCGGIASLVALLM